MYYLFLKLWKKFIIGTPPVATVELVVSAPATVAAAPATVAPAAPAVRNRNADLLTVRSLLSESKYRFRSIKALKKALGTDNRDYVLGLLNEVGARREYNNGNLYGLISRVGERASERQPVTSDGYDGDDDDDSDFDNE